ncbi:hypothetical protein BROSI_A2479 [Candidatus Brocadia sinica JPN1]|uniref:Uncharacterized protein n=1 Tax=Candidatus Brocadia sinica JPN1 TaxID=1197129 RepID=A0ABQ0JZL6_9BACT|nr:hypothetical protein BROSI_A2479 [Candidatus Brocadia sinica JPN1]GIK14214.1 MAG: hypothetical protein BroJett002_29210 [Candidatus Brocadia sinica]GJQ18222.1 MAG: hypothetical protein HBSIN01_21810 [Candidatus Brocadia sinica]
MIVLRHDKRLGSAQGNYFLRIDFVICIPTDLEQIQNVQELEEKGETLISEISKKHNLTICFWLLKTFQDVFNVV